MSTMNQTNLYFSIVPKSSSSQSLAAGGNTYDIYGLGSNTPLKSVNSPLILQMLWLNSSSSLSQDDEGTGGSGERIAGDLVNVLFDIYEANNFGASPTIAADFNKICTIKKSKDAPIKWSGRPADKSALLGHRFTIDVSEVLADLLSYSLVPVGIGTWGCIDTGSTGPQANGGTQSTYVNQFGGMNGQWIQSNVASATTTQNLYNLSANGCDRRIRIEARFEILAADGSLVESTSPTAPTCGDFWISNAAPQWGTRHDLDNRVVKKATPSAVAGPLFFTNSPNCGVGSVDPDKQTYKKIRLDDNAEYLQWFQKDLLVSGSASIDGFGIAVDYSSSADFAASTTIYLTDCTSGNRARMNSTEFQENQLRQFVQNVSPAYINRHNNGNEPDYGEWAYTTDPLSKGDYYRCYVYSRQSTGVFTKHSVYQYYQVKTEKEEKESVWRKACGMTNGVKFMWLNRLGGIDSYDVMKIFTKSVDVQTETINKKSPERLHSQNNTITGVPFNNNIGANMYPHSREVLNVDANRKYSAMTEPLTVDMANWLEELLTSPNVWIIQENDGSKYLEGRVPSERLRPSKEGYLPVIITNNESVLVDESQGLVQLNIEFVESHKINTQRN